MGAPFVRVVASLLPVLVSSLVLLPQPAWAQSKVDLTLTLVPNLYSVEAQAGKDTRVGLEVRNTGDTVVAGINLSSDKPEGWTISLDPSQITSIAPGAVRTVNVDIRPAPTVTKGDYSVTLVASAEGIQRLQFLQVRVKPASYWLWVVSGVAAVVIAVFVVVFLRVGRRS